MTTEEYADIYGDMIRDEGKHHAIIPACLRPQFNIKPSDAAFEAAHASSELLEDEESDIGDRFDGLS